MGVFWPPINEHDNVIKAALRVISADHYSDPSSPYEDAERQYSAEQLALKARDLVRAVDAKDPDEQPIGWRKDDGQAPVVVCICGSTRFMAEMAEADLRETAAGRIVVKPGCNMKEPNGLWADPVEAEALKVRLDELHRAKIRMADQVLVVGDYVGSSTTAEIAYARSLGKPVRFTNPEAFGVVCDCGHEIPHVETECGGETEPFMAGRSVVVQAVIEASGVTA